MTSYYVNTKDVIYHPFLINSQYLKKTCGFDGPGLITIKFAFYCLSESGYPVTHAKDVDGKNSLRGSSSGFIVYVSRFLGSPTEFLESEM